MRRLAAGLLFSGIASAQLITTVAGTDWIFQGEGRQAAEIPLGPVEQIATGPDGAIYAADPGNQVVLKIAQGVVTIVAGNGLRGYSGDGVPARATSLYVPKGVAIDRRGNIYIADSENHRVRMVDTSGVIRTVAGTGDSGDSGDNGPATAARLNTPCSVAVDGAGNLYIDDRLNSRIRRVGPEGIIRTVLRVGNGFNTGAITSDAAGNIYVPDAQGNRILRIDAASLTSTVIAGTGVAGFSPDGTSALVAALNYPSGVAVDGNGLVYFTDRYNELVRRIENGVLRTVAGSGDQGLDGGPVPALQARFNTPFGLAFDAQGDLLVADIGNSRIRRIVRSGGSFSTVNPVAGNGLFRFFADNSPAALAFLTQPRRAVAAADGTIYVTDTSGGKIRRIDPAGRISTLTARRAQGAGSCGGDTLQFDFPIGLALGTNGLLYVSDYGSDVVYRVDLAAGTFGLFAGACFQRGFRGEGVAATGALFNAPAGLAVDAAGNVFIADTDNHVVRRVGVNGVITTVAGIPRTASQGVVEENVPATQARLAAPHAVAIDAGNNLLIADRYNDRIRRVGGNGMIATVAGGGSGGLGDNGPARQARLFQPWDVAVDRSNNLLIADAENHRVRMVRADGVIATVAGSGNQGFSGDGGPATAAALNYPTGVVPLANGAFLIVDSDNDRIRRVAAETPVLSVSPQALEIEGISGGPRQVASLRVNSSIPGLPFQVSSNQSWLTLTASASTLPATIDLTASLDGLPEGERNAEVRIAAPPATPITVTVRLRARAAQPARLQADLSPLLFSIAADRLVSASRTFKLSNAGSGRIGFRASAVTETEPRWLLVAPENGAVSAAGDAFLNVTVDPSGLTPGTYKGSIRVQSDDGLQQLVKPAVLTVTPALGVRPAQSGLTFYAIEGSSAGQTQMLDVMAPPGSGSQIRAATSPLDGNPRWLSVSPVSSPGESSVAPVAVSVDPTGLAAGVYYAEILITSDTSTLAQSGVVVFNIVPRGSSLRPLAQPAGLIFTSTTGVNPPSQEITLFNPGIEPLRFNSNSVTLDGAPWIVYQPPSGEIAPGQRIRLAVQPNVAGLRPGIYRAAITFVFSGGFIQVVPAAFVVTQASGTPGAARLADSCTPTELVPVFTITGRDFVAPTGWPTPVEVRVLDNCGQPVTSGAVTLAFTNADAPLSMSHVRDGRWSATWVSRNAAAGATGVTATAQVTSPVRITGTASISGSVSAQRDVPIVPPGAVVVAGNALLPNLLAPGTLTSVYGVGLSAATEPAAQIPLPQRLSGTSVAIAGRLAPLTYVSEGQINLMIPYDVPAGSTLPVVVRRQGAISVPQSVSIAPAMPSVFIVGGNQAAVVGADGQLISAPAPAQAGGVIVVYCGGLGAVNPGVVTGDPAPAQPLSGIASDVEVEVGGRRASVLYAGLTPGFAGLYQINVALPEGVTGPAVPVAIRVAGQSGVPIEIPIR